MNDSGVDSRLPYKNDFLLQKILSFMRIKIALDSKKKNIRKKLNDQFDKWKLKSFLGIFCVSRSWAKNLANIIAIYEMG